MGCCGDREKAITVSEEQRWDYITLSDFKSTSCLAPLSYVWLWILIIISVAVYAADAFTAVTLLAFNKWSSQVKPKVPFEIAKWIFAITIIISYVFLAYRWIKAWRVIRSGGVAESFLEPLAAIFQCMRITKTGQGWRRFLVFAELTRSRKGADYIALFVYFQFKGALIIVVAQGPRIVINALTLWAVMQAQLIPTGDHAAPKGKSPVAQFFINIETMASTGNRQETIIYFTMLFSLVIWVIAALSLFLSLLFYVFFLWHYIPSTDGRLSKYCRRKIETRLERIIAKKVRKAIEKEGIKRKKEEQRAMKKGTDVDSLHHAPTLPKLADDDSASMYSLARSDTLSTTTTLPPYPGLPTRTNTMNTMSTTKSFGMKPSLPSINGRPYPERSDTGYSTTSYGSNAPLLSQAGSMGVSTPTPPMPALDRNADYFSGAPGGRPMPQGLPGRPYSPMSQGRASPRPPRSPLPAVDTSFPGGRVSPSPQLISPLPNDPRSAQSSQGFPPYPSNRRPGASPLGPPTFSPYNNRGPQMGASYEMSPVDMTPSDSGPERSFATSNGPNNFRQPPLPNALRAGSPAPSQGTNGSFTSPPPSRSGTGAPPSNPRAGLPATLQSAIQRREASQPLPNRGQIGGMAQQQRSATAPLRQPAYAPAPTDRSYTTTPGGYGNGYGQSRGGEQGW